MSLVMNKKIPSLVQVLLPEIVGGRQQSMGVEI